MSHPTKRSRRRGTVGAAVALLGLLLATGSHGVAAQEGVNNFDLTARADAFIVEVTEPATPAIPEGEVVFATPASAQARFDSLGGSRGFAAAPNPGDFVIAAPRSVGAVTGLPAVNYPAFVASDHPSQPEGEEDGQAYLIRSRSDASGTEAIARTGVEGDDLVRVGAVEALARAEDDGSGGVVAAARSITSGLFIGDVLSLGDLTSTVSVTIAPDGETEVSSSISVDVARVAGVGLIEITEDGPELAGVPLPGAADLLEDALAGVGVEQLRFIDAEEDETGITSSALEIILSGDAVPSETFGPRTRIVVGQVSASASSGQGAEGFVVDEPDIELGELEPDSDVDDQQFDAAPPPVGDDEGFAAPDGPGQEGTPSAEAPEVADGEPQQELSAAPPASPGGFAAAGHAASAAYLLLSVGGLSMVLGSRLLGNFAVRRRLTGSLVAT